MQFLIHQLDVYGMCDSPVLRKPVSPLTATRVRAALSGDYPALADEGPKD